MNSTEPSKIIRKKWNTYEIKFGTHFQTGLGDDATIADLPDVHLYFAHHAYSIEWNEVSKRNEVVKDKHTFFGGSGEGGKFQTWHEALLASLYGAYQVHDCFRDGDVFQATYSGDTRYFVCSGIHVIESPVCTNRHCPDQPHVISEGKA